MNISRPNSWSLTISIVDMVLRKPGSFLSLLNPRYIRTLIRAIYREPLKVILYNLLARLIQKGVIMKNPPTGIYRNKQIVLQCEILTFFRSRVYVSGWAQAKWGIEDISLLQDGTFLEKAIYGHRRPDLDTFFQKEDDNPYGFYLLAKPLRTPDILQLEVTGNAGSKLSIPLSYTAPYSSENYERLRQMEAALIPKRISLPFFQTRKRLAYFYLIERYPGHTSDLPATQSENPRDSHFEKITTQQEIKPTHNDRKTWCLFTGRESLLIENIFPVLQAELKKFKDRGLIYWDEDIMDQDGNYHSPHYKPDFNQTYLLSWNYIGDNLCVDSMTVLEYLTESGKSLQDISIFPLILYAIQQKLSVLHIPHVLTSRKAIGFINEDTQFYAKIITGHLENCHLKARILPGLAEDTFQIKYRFDREPGVDIIIPFRDQGEMLWSCLEKIYARNSYSNFNVRLINNNSTETYTFEILQKICREFPRITLDEDRQPFNFSRINNEAALKSTAKYILFLNSDTEVINTDWLENLVSEAEAPMVAAVGACLLYPDDTVQHAGVIVGLGGVAEHAHKHYDACERGYFNKLICSQEVLACTAACLLVNRELFHQVGGFEEEHLPINFNDVDLCLRLHELGYKIIYSPYARLYHYESLTRGRDLDMEDYVNMREEARYIKTRWKSYIQKGDPNYPTFFSYANGSYSLR